MNGLLQHSDLLVFLVLVTVGYLVGSRVEKKHYASLAARERELLTLPTLSAETFFRDGRVKESFLVSGSVVISIDYFKRMLANLRNIFGGRVKSYETLVDRARREAILRMQEEARQRGAELVVNLKLETATIGRNANRKGNVGSVEAIAYGTAVILNPK